MGHEAEEQLEKFIKEIEACRSKEELAKHVKVLTSDSK